MGPPCFNVLVSDSFGFSASYLAGDDGDTLLEVDEEGVERVAVAAEDDPQELELGVEEAER